MNEQTVIGLSDPDRKALFLEAQRNTGMVAEMIEKDFWVCWTLRHLFELPEAKDHFIFKGGTSLSKVWRVIQRFPRIYLDTTMLIVKEVVAELGYYAPYYFFRIFQKTLAPRRWPTGGR